MNRRSVESTLSISVSKGRNGKHGVKMLHYAVIGDCRSEVLDISDEYERRFGIESSYRLMNQARARTSSTNAAFRLLLGRHSFHVSKHLGLPEVARIAVVPQEGSRFWGEFFPASFVL